MSKEILMETWGKKGPFLPPNLTTQISLWQNCRTAMNLLKKSENVRIKPAQINENKTNKPSKT